MKKQSMTIMAVAMLFATLAVALVRAQDADNVAVTIPFDFAIGGKTLPAGGYYLRRSLEGPRIVMQIRSKDDNQSFYLSTHPLQGRDVQAESKLVFNRYGDQYFLSQVWIAGRTDGQELARTSRERVLQREIAKSKTKPEAIAVAGRPN